MAAKRFHSLLLCAIFGHKWRWRGNEAPYRCHRCNQYDDAPHVVRAAQRRAWFRVWSPIWPQFTKHGFSLRIGWAYKPFTACVSFGVGWRFARTGELPEIHAAIDIWRLRIAAGLGGGWQDEDGETRGFVYFTSKVQTYGWRWIGCWLGHKPEPSQWSPNDVYCARCDEPIKERESSDAKVAA